MRRFRLFALGLLVFLIGWRLLYAAMQPTATVQADLNAIPGGVLYLLGFVLMVWAMFAPTKT